MTKEQKFTCPVCGYAHLDSKPYKSMPEISATRNQSPPYENLWGWPSYGICDCCRLEFGNSDNGMHPENNASFVSYLKEWVQEENCQWFDPGSKPENWSLKSQLEQAGIEVPNYVSVMYQISGKL